MKNTIFDTFLLIYLYKNIKQLFYALTYIIQDSNSEIRDAYATLVLRRAYL